MPTTRARTGELDDDKAHARAHDEAAARAGTINAAGLGAQAAYLYQGCVSEAAFRALLRDLMA